MANGIVWFYVPPALIYAHVKGIGGFRTGIASYIQSTSRNHIYERLILTVLRHGASASQLVSFPSSCTKNFDIYL